MEYNQAYAISTENTYEYVDERVDKQQQQQQQTTTQVQDKNQQKPKIVCFIVTAVVTLIIALLASVLAVVAIALTQTSTTVNTSRDDLSNDLQELRATVQKVMEALPLGTLLRPATSCKDIPLSSLSGEYWIQTDSNITPIQVYCDTNPRNCNATAGWMRVANLDMTDPSEQCPDGLTLVTTTTEPQRTCGRPGALLGCVSTTYPTHGIEYSSVCGRVIGYQYGTQDAFQPYYENTNNTIDNQYVDGVSLTHGSSPRQHIWTFANAVDEINSNHWVCPCIQPQHVYTGLIPPFIGQDYFCATGSRQEVHLGRFYSDDPLWDGRGCGGTSTCCSFNAPPWFCKHLPQLTTDDIELRLCGNDPISTEDTKLEMIDIYVQ